MNKQIQIDNIIWLIESQFKTIAGYLKKEGIDKLSLGMSAMYLNSILELLFSTKLLLKKGFIESAGAVATSLWERSINLQYILTDSTNLSKENANHNFMKRNPWNIKSMLRGIVNGEKLPNNRNADIETELLYFQYTFLCAIKHGNPSTLSYLNRLEKNNKEKKVIKVKSNISIEDEDLKIYILSLSSITALDALIKFSLHYCNQDKIESLVKMYIIIETMVKDIPLQLPKFMKTNLNEFNDNFLKYIKKMYKNQCNGI
jgi:hypothetical protein